MTKSALMTVVAASSLVSAQPLAAATLPDERVSAGQRTGAFAGARVRLALGGSPEASAALTLAPMQRAVAGDGAVRMRFGEGLALGVSGEKPVALTLAGTRVDRLGIAANAKIEPNASRHGISTLGYVAIGVGVLVVAAVVLYGACGSGEICNTEDQ